ncbi:hypothetical protein EMIT0158MI4_80073 [Burkholderia ambifaria]
MRRLSSSRSRRPSAAAHRYARTMRDRVRPRFFRRSPADSIRVGRIDARLNGRGKNHPLPVAGQTDIAPARTKHRIAALYRAPRQRANRRHARAAPAPDLLRIPP